MVVVVGSVSVVVVVDNDGVDNGGGGVDEEEQGCCVDGEMAGVTNGRLEKSPLPDSISTLLPLQATYQTSMIHP